MDSKRAQRNLGRSILGRALLAAALVMATMAVALPVSASGHSVDVAITFAGSDSDCSTGSDKLVSSALPFDVEACFTQDGSPLAGRNVYLDVVHGDGETERIDGITDASGNVMFTVTPTSAGSTIATICDDEGCYDSVELSSESPPPPPIPPYSPSGNDVGNTEMVTDDPLDMIDAFTGSEAGPEASSSHGGMDIRSFRYAGLVDGKATFKVTMVGDGKALFNEGIPRWDVNVNVTTPDGTSFSVFFSNNNGEPNGGVFAGGNRLGEEPTLTWADGETLCLSAAGVDVPAGSSITVSTGASRDEGSGVYDELSGTAVASDDDDSGSETDSGGSDTSSGETGGTSTTSGGDDGGFGLLDLGLIGFLIALILAAFGMYYFDITPKRLFRFDRGDAGEYIDDPEPDDDDDDDDDDGPDTGPATTDDPGGPAVTTDPPEDEKDCEPERREFAAAQAAKDAAFAAGEEADKKLRDAKDEWGKLDAQTHNPLGDKPEFEPDPNASEQEQTRQRNVHELYLAQWQEYQDVATDAKSKVDAAKAAMDKARADSEEAWQDFQRCRRRLEAARVALDNCDGSAPAADDDEPGGGDTGGESGGGDTGGESGGGSPGTFTPPPGTSPEPPEPEGCTDGHEKYGEIIETHDFRFLGGDITVDIPHSGWAAAGNVMGAEQFAELSTSTVEELSAGIEQRVDKGRMRVLIPTTIRTIECRQILVCSDNEWVKGRIETIMTEAPGPTIEVLPTGATGAKIRESKDKRHAGPMVEEAQGELEALQEAEEEANDFTCD